MGTSGAAAVENEVWTLPRDCSRLDQSSIRSAVGEWGLGTGMLVEAYTGTRVAGLSWGPEDTEEDDNSLCCMDDSCTAGRRRDMLAADSFEVEVAGLHADGVAGFDLVEATCWDLVDMTDRQRLLQDPEGL